MNISGSQEVKFVVVDVDNLVHFFDLLLDLVEVLEDVDQLFVAGVLPVLTLFLHLHDLFLHLLVVFDVLAQLVGVLPLAQTFGHHVQSPFDLVLLTVHTVESP